MSRSERNMPIGSVAVGEQRDGVIVVTVAGEQDQSNAAELQLALLAAAAANVVVVDVSLTTFISAGFIGAVSAAAAGQACRGGLLRVRGASPFTRRLFGLCALDGLLDPPSTFERVGPHRPVARRTFINV